MPTLRRYNPQKEFAAATRRFHHCVTELAASHGTTESRSGWLDLAAMAAARAATNAHPDARQVWTEITDLTRAAAAAVRGHVLIPVEDSHTWHPLRPEKLCAVLWTRVAVAPSRSAELGAALGDLASYYECTLLTRQAWEALDSIAQAILKAGPA